MLIKFLFKDLILAKTIEQWSHTVCNFNFVNDKKSVKSTKIAPLKKPLTQYYDQNYALTS